MQSQLTRLLLSVITRSNSISSARYTICRPFCTHRVPEAEREHPKRGGGGQARLLLPGACPKGYTHARKDVGLFSADLLHPCCMAAGSPALTLREDLEGQEGWCSRQGMWHGTTDSCWSAAEAQRHCRAIILN